MKKIIDFLGQKFLYDGSFKNNKPDGYGILKNTKGIIYQGNFKEGKLNGDGVYSGPQTLKNIIYDFTELEGTPSEYRVVGQFKNNKLHGNNVYIFTSQGDFFLGVFRNGHVDKSSLPGYVVEEEGRVISLIRWSKEIGFYEYLPLKGGKSFDMKHEIFVKEYIKQFKEYGWFPKEICKNKDEFKKKINDWKLIVGPNYKKNPEWYPRG